MLEMFIKRRDNAQQHKKDLEEAKAQGLEEVPIEDKDFLELNNLIQQDKAEDAIKLAMIEEEDD